jgi:hypothetical protein
MSLLLIYNILLCLQLVPLLMLDTMSRMPGLNGFVFASILTASLG